jgi:hypothetical protein
MEGRGRRRKQLPSDLKETRRYHKWNEKTLDRTVWRTRLEKVYGPIVGQTTELMNARSKVFVSEVLISSRSFWKQKRLESEM